MEDGIIQSYTLREIANRTRFIKTNFGTNDKGAFDYKFEVGDKMNSENKKTDREAGIDSKKNGGIFFGETKIIKK